MFSAGEEGAGGGREDVGGWGEGVVGGVEL